MPVQEVHSQVGLDEFVPLDVFYDLGRKRRVSSIDNYDGGVHQTTISCRIQKWGWPRHAPPMPVNRSLTDLFPLGDPKSDAAGRACRREGAHVRAPADITGQVR